MKKRGFLLMTVCILIVGLLAGCGAGGGQDESQIQSNTESETENESSAEVTDGLHIGSGSSSDPDSAVGEWLKNIGLAP